MPHAISIADFDYPLPDERVAKYPLPQRDASKLLVFRTGDIHERQFTDLPDELPAGTLLVFNNTRVIPARLTGRRVGRGSTQPQIEITLHLRSSDDEWLAFAKPGRKLEVGDNIVLSDGFDAQVCAKSEGGEIGLRFNRSGADLDAAIAVHGVMPLPPYIASRRQTDEQDNSDYQTMFAAHDGAVAAPTASLHFTPNMMAGLNARGIGAEFITLHVGAGTFLPVKADDTENHKMHSEWGQVPDEVAQRLMAARAAGGRIIAVGTTALRVLETAAENDGTLKGWSGLTDIFITPGYRFRIVDGLMTNFHLPKSTLFMLVSAFAGLDTMKGAYRHAIENRYRFYSYGDSSLLWPQAK